MRKYLECKARIKIVKLLPTTPERGIILRRQPFFEDLSMALRKFVTRSDEKSSHAQDLRGLLNGQPKMGSFAALTIKGLSDKSIISALAEEFSSTINRFLPTGEVEIVTNIREEGSHKKQTIHLFALSLYVHHNHPEAQMSLTTPRFSEEHESVRHFAESLHISEEVLHTLHQSGLHLGKRTLSSHDLHRLADGHSSLEEQTVTKEKTKNARSA